MLKTGIVKLQLSTSVIQESADQEVRNPGRGYARRFSLKITESKSRVELTPGKGDLAQVINNEWRRLTRSG